MKRLAILLMTAIMLLALAVPAMALDGECGCGVTCAPWCGEVRSMGYWKNDGVSANNSWMGWRFASPSGGNYRQIFANQAIAFHNNWIANESGDCIEFQDVRFHGPCGRYIPMEEMNAMVEGAMANINTIPRSDLLKLKNALDSINNGNELWVCTNIDS
jgi:hypothetical protein